MTILSIKQVVERTSLSRATIYRKVRNDPSFPALIAISVGRTGVDEEALNAWLTGVKVAAEAGRKKRQEQMRELAQRRPGRW
ncbi:MAG TPA: AlpA family phage regulatory protein [Thermoanaerobaculia bacterium]|nr:AlpA family phage regulatory protein [Thermoanaerobaculia bacterium]